MIKVEKAKRKEHGSIRCSSCLSDVNVIAITVGVDEQHTQGIRICSLCLYEMQTRISYLNRGIDPDPYYPRIDLKI